MSAEEEQQERDSNSGSPAPDEDEQDAFDRAFDDWGDEEEGDTQEGGTGQQEGGDQDDAPGSSIGGAAWHAEEEPWAQPLTTMLPRELQMRVFAFLSADDLTKASLVCRSMHQLAQEEVLWRRLFCARWGKPATQQGDASWKAQYMARDAEEGRRVEAMHDDEGMRAMYMDMQRARRQQTLGRGAIDDHMEVPKSQLQERLAAWIRTHRPPHTQQQQQQGQGQQHAQQVPQHSAASQYHHPVASSPTLSLSPPHTSSCSTYEGFHYPNSMSPVHPSLRSEPPLPAHPQGLGHQQPQHAAGRAGPSGMHSQPGFTTAVGRSSGAGPSRSRSGEGPCQHQHQQASTSDAAVQGAGQGPMAPGPAAATPAGAPGAWGQRPDLSRGKQAYTWDRIGDYHCCRETGWVHLCDHTCKEGVIDREHDMIVCPISGRTLERLLTECEVRALQGREAGEEEEGCEVHDDAADFAGFVGRAFERGYSCSDEKELRRVCGVRLR